MGIIAYNYRKNMVFYNQVPLQQFQDNDMLLLIAESHFLQLVIVLVPISSQKFLFCNGKVEVNELIKLFILS